MTSTALRPRHSRISFGSMGAMALVHALSACSEGRPLSNGASAALSTTSCGDTWIDAPEQCDDGNQRDDDGCSGLCESEPGWSCEGEPSVCRLLCGNGRADKGEMCDDPRGNSDAWSLNRHCNATCTGLGPSCGDKILQTAFEGCDDGNRVAWDGCSPNCQIEPGWLCEGEPSTCLALCGNGIRDRGETCDDGENNSDAWSLSRHCNSDCSGSAPYCGDGWADADEQCDRGHDNSDKLPDACRANCQKARCGDGVVDSDEGCDDGGRSARCTEHCTNAKSALLTAGDKHTCVILETGAAKCWGANDRGQLGAGALPLPAHRFSPVGVAGLDSGVTMLDAGGEHTCALKEDGTLTCWGANTSGQLGHPYAENIYDRPVEVTGLGAKVEAVAAGGEHTCALLAGGEVKCWGNNDSGQTGSGSKGDSERSPIAVTGLGTVQQLVAGGKHTCALLQSGGVKCWGSNALGAIGDGTDEPLRKVPTSVAGLERGVRAITAGWGHTCALLDTKKVVCWGWNRDGQVGNGSQGWQEEQLTPIEVLSLDGPVQSLAAGGAQTCALLETGAVQCWGLLVAAGGAYVRMPTPVAISELGYKATSVAAGGNHTCALVDTHGVQCWGDNSDGQLGNGNAEATDPQPDPVIVVGLPG